jgi:hypothetical protein
MYNHAAYIYSANLLGGHGSHQRAERREVDGCPRLRVVAMPLRVRDAAVEPLQPLGSALPHERLREGNRGHSNLSKLHFR